MAGSVWTRKKGSAPRETLSREQIVAAALALLDEQGVGGLNMRKLADRLGAGTTSLYWHVQTKDDLIELVVDEVYGEVDVPAPGLAGWRNGVTLFAHSLRAAVLRHQWIPEVIYGRPSMGPQAVVLGSRGLALFEAAGFDELDIDFAMGTVMAYVFGISSSEVAWRRMAAESGSTEAEWTGEVVDEALAMSDGDPAMTASINRRSADPGALQDRSFTFGLETILDGLQSRLRSSDRG